MFYGLSFPSLSGETLNQNYGKKDIRHNQKEVNKIIDTK